VQKTLTVLADPAQVRIVDGTQVLVSHPRSYDRGAQIEDPVHIQTLIDRKRQARHHHGQNRLNQAAPASQTLLAQAAERGDNLGAITSTLLRWLARYGPNAVRLALERRREARHQAPPVDPCLSENVQQRDNPIQVHPLGSYDQIANNTVSPNPLPPTPNEPGEAR